MLVSVDEHTFDQIGAPLASAIDGLLELDPDTLGDDELTQTVISLHRQQARLAAAVTQMTAAADARRIEQELFDAAGPPPAPNTATLPPPAICPARRPSGATTLWWNWPSVP